MPQKLSAPWRVRQFTTEGLPEPARVAEWERYNAEALVGLEVQLSAGEGLRAVELNLELPRVKVARVHGTAHSVRRDEAEVARHPGQGIVVYLAMRGAGSFVHRSGVESIAPGQGILVDADQPFERGFASGLTEIVLKVPRRALAASRLATGVREPRVFSFSQGVDGPGRRLASAAQKTVQAGPAAGQLHDQEVFECVAGLLNDDAMTSHLAAAKAFIAQHYHRPELSAADVAQAISVSTRQLSRVFANAGDTLPQAVLSVRLERAWSMLKDPQWASLPISELSAYCGFASHAQFGRRFRDRFGVTPRQRRTMGADE